MFFSNWIMAIRIRKKKLVRSVIREIILELVSCHPSISHKEVRIKFTTESVITQF
jgi:hypothetical protein